MSPIATAVLYAKERDATRDRVRWLMNAASIADERGAMDKARRLRSAGKLVERAASILDDTTASRKKSRPS